MALVLLAATLAAATTATAAPVVVPIAVSGGTHPTVEVRVGNGRAVPVLLDTGSVGLHLYAGAVPHNATVTRSTTPNSITYVDGTVQSGVRATATVTIGGVKSGAPMAFAVIDKVRCTAMLPNCPGQGGVAAAEHRGYYGTLGIGLGPGPIDNPLIHLAAPYSHSWSISLAGSGGALTLGAPIPEVADAHFTLPADRTHADGSPAFADAHAVVCWSVGGDAPACEYTLFDSGEVGMQLFGGVLGQGGGGGSLLLPGTAVTAAGGATASPFWSFSAGSANTVRVRPGGHATVNTGVAPFYAFTVTYDAVRGSITLTAP